MPFDPKFTADSAHSPCQTHFVKFRVHAIFIRFVLAFCLTETALRADWRDEIGFTRLKAIAGAELPTTAGAGLTQVEALEYPGNYSPDPGNALLTGKTFALKSGSSGASNHATHVATNFYATTSLLPGNAAVDIYSADGWMNGDFLRVGTSNLPVTETRAVQNHSWAYIPNANANPPISSLTEAQVAEIDKRLDYSINQDGFVCAVGSDNNSSTTLPQLLCQSYNTISVGRDDGLHSAGFTAHDGSGRIKPDIVAPSANPEYATSWTTPMVAGAAGLLRSKLAASYAQTGANLPRAVKALLLASATKNTVPNWNNTSARPLDDIYGAGELNVHHAYLALRAGKAAASSGAAYGIRGWAAESVSGNAAKTWFFTIPAGATSTPFCAALTWHRVATKSKFLNTWSATLANLNLRLHQASAFTVGAQIAASSSAVDNVELVYQPELPPGTYALVVQNTSATATDIGLAWHSLPAVTVAATTPLAKEIDGQAGVITITRSGDSTLPIQVPLTIGGTAVAGVHYQALPSSVTIPVGQSFLTLQVTPIADSLAQGDRTVTVAVAADFSLVRDAAQFAVVTIQDKPFDAWRFANFTIPERADPAISGETADPDADNLANLIEYALGLTPKSPDTAPVALVDSSGYLGISAEKSNSATDITWGAEVTSTLDSWNPAVIVTETSSAFTARDMVPMAASGQRFIRLKITRP
jgi:hypothetical protein